MSIRRSNREELPQLPKRTPAGKAGIAVSAFSFFAALGVLGWFGLSGLDTSDHPDGMTPREEFEAAFRAESESRRTESVQAAEEYRAQTFREMEDETGEFGDPMTDTFDERAGGWGTSQ